MAQAIEHMQPRTEIMHGAAMAMTPMDMLEKAIVSGAGIETLTKLMDLQERFEKNAARKDFDEAIAAAKADISPIGRNATGHNSKRYADFAAIAKAVDPVISKFGLSYRFRTTQTDRIHVTCILSHKSGHSEETTLAGPPDASGSKNAIQAIGSTLTYLQRYSLIQALGLAASNDDDGKASGQYDEPALITHAQVQRILSLLEETNSDTEKFCEVWKINAVPEMPARQFDSAIQMLEKKKARIAGGAA